MHKILFFLKCLLNQALIFLIFKMINYFLQLKNFDKNFRIFTPIFMLLSTTFLFFAISAIASSPNDYQQSNAVKIMYIHVPSAWMSLLIYCLMASFNIGGFIWKNRFFLRNRPRHRRNRLCLHFNHFNHGRDLGQADLGHLVGVGRASYFNVNFILFIFGIFTFI